nr:hypothetical protein [uncultured Holophaga sp.]
MKAKSNRRSRHGLLILFLLAFLMPFLTLSCSGTRLMTMSGVQVAAGTNLTLPNPMTGEVQKEKVPGEPLAALACLLGILSLGLSFLRGRAGKAATAVGSLLSLLALLLVKARLEQSALKQGPELLSLQWEFGYWLALLAALAVCVLSFIPSREPAVAPDELPAPSEN